MFLATHGLELPTLSAEQLKSATTWYAATSLSLSTLEGDKSMEHPIGIDQTLGNKDRIKTACHMASLTYVARLRFVLLQRHVSTS